MSKAKYVLMPKLLTPEVNPGKAIELEIFITGGGPVDEGKLYLTYPSTIINKEKPGEGITSIKVAKDTRTGRIIQPVSGEPHLQSFPCEAIGAIILLNEGNFLDIPNQPTTGLLKRKMGEYEWDKHAPVFVKLNIDEQAHSGDYEIRLALSYASSGDVEIAKEAVNVHITNWPERHPWVIIAGVIASILSVIVGGIALLHW
jgi:hypothetical protein